MIRNNCEVFIHINNDFREDWPSFKRILGFEYEVKDLCYERFIENDLTDPYLPKATEAMNKLVQHITTKYTGKKIGVFCSNDDIASLFERQCLKNNIDIPNTIESVSYTHLDVYKRQEQWDEKITDCINYLILLKALIKEEQAYGSH